MNGRALKNWVFLLAVAPIVGGCVAFGPYATRSDPTSPLSPRVEALVAANREYPRWEDFPRAPVDIPTNAEFATRVGATAADGTAVQAEVDALTWDLDDPATLGAAIRSQINEDYASPATAQTAAEVEAFARRLRERATPPPPLN